MAWKAFLIEAEDDVGTSSEMVPDVVFGIGINGRAAGRGGCRSKSQGERSDWPKPARPSVQPTVPGGLDDGLLAHAGQHGPSGLLPSSRRSANSRRAFAGPGQDA